MYLCICIYNIKKTFLEEHMCSLQYAELFRVNVVFVFVFLCVYLSLYLCIYLIVLGEHVCLRQQAELYRVNVIFVFVFLLCIFVFVFVNLSYCPGRACVFTTVGGVVVSNEQRKLLSHPVVILNTSDFLYLYLCACIRLYVYLYLCLRILSFTHTSYPVAI